MTKNSKKGDTLNPSTLCVHAGRPREKCALGVVTPVFPSTSYEYPNPTGQYYPRYFNTPNHNAVAAKLAVLEKGDDALVLSSGMAGISSTVAAYVKPGDHIVAQADVYGGTFHLLSGELQEWGVEVTFAENLEEVARAIRPNTRILYFESPSNPLLRVFDLAAAARIGKKHGILTVVDNTFATPLNQQPLALGFDVVIHSGTKYLNGHSDVNCGAVVSSKKRIERIRQVAINRGGTLDAHACWLLERGLKTLALRVSRQNENALRLAKYLSGHSAVACVNYPGLSGHPDHAVAKKQMRGFGGMFSFEIRRGSQVNAVLKKLRVVLPAMSLGGVESLICVPAQTSHVKLSAAERAAVGISDGLMRVSVGIEDFEDLRRDFEQALPKK